MDKQKSEILQELERLEQEKEELSKWLLKNDLTPQAVGYLNAQIDGYDDKERELQEQLWEIEDNIRMVQLDTFNAEGVGDYLKEFVRSFEENYDAQYSEKYGKYRIIRIKEAVEKFIECRNYSRGIARIKCTNSETGYEY